jgi:hypothetical protein
MRVHHQNGITMTIATGLLIAGRKVLVDGLTIYNSFDLDWCRLDPGDYTARRITRPHLLLDHTTGGLWPQRVLPGAGPRGHAEQIARMWSGQDRGNGARIHSGAQILIDFDGSIYCLVDLVTCAAYHAELANDASVGIEHCTTPRGEIYQATLDASAPLHLALCNELGIPHQIHAGAYRNMPLARCETGAKTATHDGRAQSKCADLYGILQHRDQTSERGRGDAGDALIAAHLAAGAEGLDYSNSDDLVRGRARQLALNALDAAAAATWRPLVVDGLVGQTSLAAARRLGYSRWRDVPLTL